MVSVRTYLNLRQAGWARSFLEHHNIFCRLGNENAHLYGGAPFAMPIQLLVFRTDAARANLLLVDFETGAAVEAHFDDIERAPISSGNEEFVTDPAAFRDNDPWEILVIAGLTLLPGILLLLQTRPLLLLPVRRYFRSPNVMIVSPVAARVIGGCAVTLAVCFLALYFYTRAAIARDQFAKTSDR